MGYYINFVLILFLMGSPENPIIAIIGGVLDNVFIRIIPLEVG